MNPPTAKKFCKKCNAETERYSDGKCKPCKRARMAARHAANKERMNAISRAYYEANRDARRAYNAAWRVANPEKERASGAAWRAANKERKSANGAAWYAANKGLFRIYNHNRRARKRESGGKLSPGLSAKLFKLQKGKCACGCKQPLGDNYHLDHIMPLALGGSNTNDNIQLLRQRCNNQKSAKHPVEFMQQRGFLL